MECRKWVFPKIILLFLLTNLCSSGFSQSKKQVAAEEDITLVTTGIHYESLIRNIFIGNFLDIPFNRDEVSFSSLINTYIVAYSDSARCGTFLPADKKELTRQECDEWWVTTNIYGDELSRDCLRWKTVKTGIFAKPDLYNAVNVVDNMQRDDLLRTTLKVILKGDPIATMMNLGQEVTTLRQDMEKLIALNDCDSKGLKRFEENLSLFALNKQPIVLGADPTQKSIVEMISNNQNYNEFIDALIVEQSKEWLFNQYLRGHISDVTITSSDQKTGLPAEMTAGYLYKGWNGTTAGVVRITFTNGLPECLYYSDNPTTCRTASRQIAADYAKGRFANK